jgi:PDZ domain-containing protein
VSALLVLILGVFAFSVPLPFSVTVPGNRTFDALGTDEGTPVIEVTGAEVHPTEGSLRVTTIQATTKETELRLPRLLQAWWDDEEAVVPKEALYPSGKSAEKVDQANIKDMVESQDHATVVALRKLGLDPAKVKVNLRLGNVGGPSAGLMFSLGIIDKLSTENITGGKNIAGTGTIDDNGKVGEVGGVPLKMLSAKHDGATVFLLPKGECSEAERARPDGLKLIPVSTLDGALAALKALREGGKVPSC